MHRLALLALILPFLVLSFSGCKEQAGKTLDVKIQGAIPLHAVLNAADTISASVNYQASPTSPLLSYRWDVVSAPVSSATVVISGATGQVSPASGITSGFTFGTAGTYVIRLVVFQQSGNIQASDDATVIVTSSSSG